MTIRLLAMLGLAPFCALAAEPQIGLYYSFDRPPSSLVLSELQNGVIGALSGSALSVEWRELGGPLTNYPEIFVIRFRGDCAPAPPGTTAPLHPGEQALASTQISDGRVLPFAEVHCDLLRRYLGTSSAKTFGQAMAKVTTHEIFHMITRSTDHSSRGAAKATYSRNDLLSGCLPFQQHDLNRVRHTE
jgi:hypothetical protein